MPEGKQHPMTTSGNDVTMWEERQRSVIDANRHMFENHIACDINFLFHQQKERCSTPHQGLEVIEKVEAHRYVLCARSPVFYAMLCGPLATETVHKTLEVDITDMTAEPFTEVLRFLYYEEANLTGDNVFSVLYGAKKYLIDPLANLCRSYLKQSLTVDDVCTILDQSLAFSEQGLVQHCMRFIRSRGQDVVKCSSFTEISSEALSLVVKQEEMNIEEVELFMGCIRWGMAELQRKHNLIGEVCWPLENVSDSLPIPQTSDTNILSTSVVTTECKSESKNHNETKRSSFKMFSDRMSKKKSVQESVLSKNLCANESSEGTCEQTNSITDNQHSLKNELNKFLCKIDGQTIVKFFNADNDSKNSTITEPLRAVLATVWPFIHFETMSLEDMERTVIPTNILDKCEVESVLKKIIASQKMIGNQISTKRNKIWLEPAFNKNEEYCGQVGELIKGKSNGRWMEENEKFRNKSAQVVKRPVVKSGFTFSIPFHLFW